MTPEREDRLLQQMHDLQQQYLRVQSHMDAGRNTDQVTCSCDEDPSRETAIPHDGTHDGAPGTTRATNESGVSQPVVAKHTCCICKNKSCIKGLIYH